MSVFLLVTSCSEGRTAGFHADAGDGFSIADGSLGGVMGAHARRNRLAAAAGLPGTYHAWVADTADTAPLTRWDHSVRNTLPFVLPDAQKTIVAMNFVDLIDGTLQD